MRLAILWHLHQPDYRDPDTGVPVMPWVRMHAIRGYRDLCRDVVQSGAASTINVVPSLLDQLVAYRDGVRDRHLELTERPADGLDAAELDELRATFVTGNAAMIDAHPGWKRLAARIRGGDRLGVHSVRDAQVWSTLAWFGSTALRDFPELVALRAKGSGFTTSDKAAMLAAQRAILDTILDDVRAVATSGTARISASPYFHPILPLLVDNRHARRSMPGLPEESRFAWPGDALLQLTRGRARVGELTGVEPVGLWPSEGSVSPEVVALAAQAGFTWLCTDEGVLHRSDGDHAARPGGWDLGHGVRGFFRDHDLSDRIGFDYARRDPREAAAELLGEAGRRARDGVLTIALDGENPWEAFADAGDAFRRALHEGLVSGPVRGITLDEAATMAPVGRVHRLHTGSWINADFAIWIGHPEDRRAWKLLEDARRAIDEAPADRAAAALERLLPAEGSDWMWWYGDEFHTPFAPTFDRLFRAHVRAAWTALGRPWPPALDRPISRGARYPFELPRGPIDPRLDGEPSWVRWAAAGHVVWARGSAMARGVPHTTGMAFGWSSPSDAHPEGALWLRVDRPDAAPPEPEGTVWHVRAGALAVDVPYGPGGSGVQEAAAAASGARAVVARFDARELPADEVPVVVAVVRDGPVAIYPADGAVMLPRPPADPSVAWWHA